MDKNDTIETILTKIKKKNIIKKEKINQELLKKKKASKFIPPYANWKDDKKLKKYQMKNQETMDIWAVGDQLNDSGLPPPPPGSQPNIKTDIQNELYGFKIKRFNKSGMRTPKELWQRFKYLSKGLTLDEWSDRVEGSWEHMLEYTEKLWENFFIYSFKKYKWYPYAQKYWSDSLYGQNWRNWRREEDTITWQLNGRTPWHKHIRMSNDHQMLLPKKEEIVKTKKEYNFPRNVETIIGANRLKLNNQIFTNPSRHEILKQGNYNTEQPESSIFNAWYDSSNIYLKYIRPWFMRLNFLDKAYVTTEKYIGKEQHRKNYQVVPKKNVFNIELYKISYNLHLIKQITKNNYNVDQIRRIFGKRNLQLFEKNKDKVKKLLQYEKLLTFRQTNQNLTRINTALGLSLPKALNKNILNKLFLILYLNRFISKIVQVNSYLNIAWIFKPVLFFRYKTIRCTFCINCFLNWKKGVFYYIFSKNNLKKDTQFKYLFYEKYSMQIGIN